MEKLLQLLNEYQTQRGSKFKFSSYDTNSSAFIIENNPRMVLGEETIVCKKFGFIERLVTHSKVKYGSIEKMTVFDKNWKEYGYTDILLMNLAISDNPIGFLVSLLK